ncbi:hypothetical protein WR25_18861 [Diploscapter pachys]|uniref:Uncharacterized protein n=1 Tax=Diploscapter pachys TaxID=2018661 RepID=A0A2A2LUH6_9BILA|nr:hypothetical protein WR25_18861 [Diploscapter pachys]
MSRYAKPKEQPKKDVPKADKAEFATGLGFDARPRYYELSLEQYLHQEAAKKIIRSKYQKPISTLSALSNHINSFPVPYSAPSGFPAARPTIPFNGFHGPYPHPSTPNFQIQTPPHQIPIQNNRNNNDDTSTMTPHNWWPNWKSTVQMQFEHTQGHRMGTGVGLPFFNPAIPPPQQQHQSPPSQHCPTCTCHTSSHFRFPPPSQPINGMNEMPEASDHDTEASVNARLEALRISQSKKRRMKRGLARKGNAKAAKHLQELAVRVARQKTKWNDLD